jgi:hypothetical protein
MEKVKWIRAGQKGDEEKVIKEREGEGGGGG